MESKIFLLLAIIAHTACTGNSMPMKNVLVSDISIPSLETSTAPESVEISRKHIFQPVLSPETQQREMNKIEEESAIIEKRSVREESENEPTLDTEKENNDLEDLETAAGTNVLRPLFVYRQQLAYRERVKKGGRRDVPNF